MAKKKKNQKVPCPKGDHFPNYWQEIAAVPWKKFRTCTWDDFYQSRLHVWDLPNRIEGVMRLYYHEGEVVEHIIPRGTDVKNTIKSVLNADWRTKIVYADHHQCVSIFAQDNPDDDGGPPVSSPQRDPVLSF